MVRPGSIAAAFAGILTVLPAAAAELPKVMSLNLCTDQLAMLVAAPGQLISVSNLATDPSLSFLHEQAKAYPANRGTAEEVFLQAPDLVLTGTYSLHNTTELLRRLDYRVEEFAFDQTLDAIPVDLRRIGRLMGREARAEEIAVAFETERRDLERPLCGRDPTLVAFEQNGVALGAGTLGDAAIRLAGFRNLAADAGMAGMAPLALEQLVRGKPDVVLLPARVGDAPSLADQAAVHPALTAIRGARTGAFVPSASFACAAPFVLDAVRALRRLRMEIVDCAKAGG